MYASMQLCRRRSESAARAAIPPRHESGRELGDRTDMRHHCLGSVCAAAMALLGLGAVGRPAAASTIYVSDMELSNGYEFITFSGSSFSGTEYTGQQNLTANVGSSYDPNAASHFHLFAWCVDVFHDIYIGANSITYS